MILTHGPAYLNCGSGNKYDLCVEYTIDHPGQSYRYTDQ